MSAPRSFAEFWPEYLGAHAAPATRALHFIGSSLAVACHPRWNLVSKSSCTGTQFLHAAGPAGTTLYYEHRHKALAQAQQAPLGDTSITSPKRSSTLPPALPRHQPAGEFWESLNVACAKKLPLFYLIEDNGYAISVPVEVQTAGGSISRLVKGFPGLHIAECDGTDPLESYAVCKEAIAYARERRGPVLVHARVTRPYSHSALRRRKAL